jgi:hypothetical protein
MDEINPDIDTYNRNISSGKKENLGDKLSEGFIGVLGRFMGAHKSFGGSPTPTSLSAILTKARDSDNIFSSSTFHSSSYSSSSSLSTSSGKPSEQPSSGECSSEPSADISSGISSDISSGDYSSEISSRISSDLSSDNASIEKFASSTSSSSIYSLQINEANIMKDLFGKNEDLKINNYDDDNGTIDKSNSTVEINVDNDIDGLRMKKASPVIIDDDWDDWT